MFLDVLLDSSTIKLSMDVHFCNHMALVCSLRSSQILTRLSCHFVNLSGGIVICCLLIHCVVVMFNGFAFRRSSKKGCFGQKHRFCFLIISFLLSFNNTNVPSSSVMKYISCHFSIALIVFSINKGKGFSLFVNPNPLLL